MEIGMVGLGRMGGNMAQRLLRGGHRVVAYDRGAKLVAATTEQGAAGASSLEDLVSRLAPPRPVRVMVPAGPPTEETVDGLITLLSAGDTILDGGNANYRDSMRRAGKAAARARGIDFMDVGTKSQPFGARLLAAPRHRFGGHAVRRA